MKKTNPKNISNRIIISLATCLVLATFFLPISGQAISMSVDTGSTVHAKDVFVIEVSIDTEGQSVNTVEGEISISNSTGNLEVRDISIGGSGLSMWPRRPSLSVAGDSILFTGGIPGGVSGEVSMFKIIAFARNPGEILVTPHDIVAYANDGKGTSLAVSAKATVIAVQDPLDDPIDRWTGIISQDNTPPEPFEITLYQDPSLYDGKKFLSFPATDMQTGVAYYEVQEGLALPVRTGDQYVLVDQDKVQDVTVTVFDVAGNARIGIFTGKKAINWYAIVFWTLVLLLISRRKSVYRAFKKIKPYLSLRRRRGKK